MYAGLLGAIGGILGKGFYAWFINTLVFSAFKKEEAKKVRQKSPKVKGAFALVLAGIGLALVTYNPLSGNASLENSVIGVMAMAVGILYFLKWMMTVLIISNWINNIKKLKPLVSLQRFLVYLPVILRPVVLA